MQWSFRRCKVPDDPVDARTSCTVLDVSFTWRSTPAEKFLLENVDGDSRPRAPEAGLPYGTGMVPE